MPDQIPAIRRFAEQLVPADYQEGAPPPVRRAAGLKWPDFLRYVSYLDKTLAPSNVPVALKLLRALLWLKAVEQTHLDQLAGKEADETLNVLCQSAAEKLSAMPEHCPPPTRLGRLIFRTIAFEYLRRDTVNEVQAGGGQRWRRLSVLLRFARGTGRLPVFLPGFKNVEFAATDCLFGLLPAEAEAMLTRYFRVKIQGLHFCGRAFYHLPLIEGFRSLALVFPVILWLARWLAASEGRSTLSATDIARAIAVADRNHGYSPLLGTLGFRWRARLLAQRDDISRLCCWYCR